MLERRTLGDIPKKPHTLFTFRGKKQFEFVFTRDGFGGRFSIIYGETPPTAIDSIKLAPGNYQHLIGEVTKARKMPIARRHLKSGQLSASMGYLNSRRALFRSVDCRLSVVRGNALASDLPFSNGDSDELLFITQGQGQLLTMFGALPYQEHDYILIPKGVPYVLEHQGFLEALVMESSSYIEVPQEFFNPMGQLRLEAPYSHRDFRSPTRLLEQAEKERFRTILALRHDIVSEHHYSTLPVETVGWDGSVYPLAFSIDDYIPKTGKIHLPPNLHLTFRAKDFVVCSFVPRKVDYMEGAIPCPYPHANVSCDEIIYYVSGDFTSRKGIEGKSISFHPAGLPHGPQPGKYFESIGSETTNEKAVMVDTWNPLFITDLGLDVEEGTYPLSWQQP